MMGLRLSFEPAPWVVLEPSRYVPLQRPLSEALRIYWQRLKLTGTVLLCVMTLIQVVASIARLSAGPLEPGETGRTWITALLLSGLTAIALGVHRVISKAPPLLAKVGIAAAVALIGIAVNYVGVRVTQISQRPAPPTEFDSFVGIHFLEELLPPWALDLIPALFMLGFTLLGVATSIFRERIGAREKAPSGWWRLLMSTALASSSCYVILALPSGPTDPGITALMGFLNGFFWHAILQVRRSHDT